jgi:membrane-associated phospholipid phosphatase
MSSICGPAYVPRRRGVYHIVVKTLLLLLLAWVAALAAFAVTSVLAAAYDTFPNDIWLAHQIQDVDSAAVDRTLDWVEDLVDYPLIVLVCAGAAALLVLGHDRAGAIIIALAIPARAVTTASLKELIERPRPSADLLDFESQPSTFSFPSGHAGAAFVVYGLIFYFATPYISDRRVRLPVQAACVAIILLAGLERVYVGHHWPSDVLGGYYVGALLLGVFIGAHQLTLRRASNLEPQRSFSRATPARDPE